MLCNSSLMDSCYEELVGEFHFTLHVDCKGSSTLLVLVLARLVLVGRLVWLLLVLVNLRPHYFSCSPG
jgi:hypothetical protein